MAFKKLNRQIKKNRFNKREKINDKKKNYQRNDSSQIIIYKRFELYNEAQRCTNLYELLYNHLYSSIIVYVSSKTQIQRFSGILLNVNPQFIVLLSTRYIKLPFRTLYNSKFISIPIDKIDAISYPTNMSY